MARVVKLEDVRILSGHTIIDTCVDLEASDSADEPIRLFFSFRRQPLAQGGEEEEGEADDDGEGDSDEPESECSSGEVEPAEEQIMSKDCQASSCKHVEGGKACCAQEVQGDTGPPGPFTLVEYSISVARGYGGVTLPVMQIAVQGWSAKSVPSVAGIVSVDDDDVAEYAYAASGGFLADRGYAAVGEEGIELLMTALNIEEMDPPKCLAWLLEFPFYEDEWDVVGFALDELVDEQDEDEEEDDEDGEGSKHALANGSTNSAAHSSDESDGGGVHQHMKAVVSAEKQVNNKRVGSKRSSDTASKPKRQRVEQSKKR